MPDLIPLSSIKIGSRLRSDLGDIDTLAESIQRQGLIQPVVIDQYNNLVAGGRRIAAMTKLGWTDIPVYRFEVMSEDHGLEVELEENVKRKDMTWQERCVAVMRIHELKSRLGALNSQSWGIRETGALLGVSKSLTNYSVIIGKLLAAGDREIHACEHMTAAVCILVKRKEEEASKELSKRFILQAKSPGVVQRMDTTRELRRELLPHSTLEQIVVDNSTTQSQLDDEHDKIVELIEAVHDVNPEASPVDTSSFTEDPSTWVEIPLSTMVQHANCIHLMQSGKLSAHHIITDPPYGIDMENLEQDSASMDLSGLKETHDVQENIKMFPEMLRGFWEVLPDNGYCVFFYDLDHHQLLQDLAGKIGFKFQRWPLVWIKSHICMNNAAHVNFTKTVEYAMVLRKGTPVLTKPQQYCYHKTEPSEHTLTRKLYGHAFAKPMSLWEWIIRAVSLERQTLLDPFAGSGSAVSVFLSMNRVPLAIEINEAFYHKTLHLVSSTYRMFTKGKVRFI